MMQPTVISSGDNILYEEKQQLRQWWFWATIALINLIWLAAWIQQIIVGVPFGDNAMPGSDIIVIAVISLLVTGMLLMIRLETKITTQGISVRFFPLQQTFRHYAWDMIQKCYTRKYNPILDYGGWGYRLGLFGKGRALNLSGSEGLQIEFQNGKKLLIGTKRPEEIAALLKKLGFEQSKKM